MPTAHSLDYETGISVLFDCRQQSAVITQGYFEQAYFMVIPLFGEADILATNRARS